MPAYSIPFPNSPMIGDGGYVSREWNLFFQSIFQAVGGPSVVAGGGIAPIEVQKQFEEYPLTPPEGADSIRGLDEIRNMTDRDQSPLLREAIAAIDELRNELSVARSEVQNLRLTVDQIESLTAEIKPTLPIVSSVNGKKDTVVLAVGDISGAAALSGAAFTGLVSAPKFLTATGSVSAPSATVTTIYSIPNAAVSMYLVSANIGSVGDASNFSSFAVIASDTAVARIALSNNGALLPITLSGLNIQVSQSSGVVQTITVNVTKIG